MNTAERNFSVCLVAESYYPNLDGGAVHARSLAEQFASAGSNVFVITRRDFRNYPSSEELGGIPVIRIGPDNRFGMLGRYLAMFSVCIPMIRRRREYELVLVSNLRILGAPAVLLAMLMGKKCILRTDSCGELSGSYAVSDLPGFSPKKLLAGIYFRIRNFILGQADAFIAISNVIADEFRTERIPDRDIRLIPNGVDTGLYRPVDPDTRLQLHSRTGVPADALTFAYSGRLTHEKGLLSLIRVWKSLADEFDNIHLLLIGSGQNMPLSCENELRSFIKEHDLADSVTITGQVDNVTEYLQCSDIFIFPSRTEALGLALIEAQACGLPAIGSNVGGIPDVITHGVNGLLVEPDDDAQLYQAAHSMITDPGKRTRLAGAARPFVLDNFSIEHITQSYLDLFARVTGGNLADRKLFSNDNADDKPHA